MIPIYNWLL